ncbi:glycosyltransferase [Paludisphaera mucosa]|uniref:glycosyltransferase n=1 Tax=Paludisphaera mucosa TaxID=3030827 RepID=UPI003F603A32
MRIAYLVNTYPMTSASFIRRELLEVEAQGAVVDRLTLRRWATPLVDPDDLAEDLKTRAVLEVGALGLAKALLKTAATRPGLFLRGLKQAIQLGRRGSASGQGVLRHAIYLAEACVLLDWHREAATDHVHAHYGTNGATVALLTRTLGGPPFSFTTHGPEEFDRPLALGLDVKVASSAFAVAVSEYGRSQLCRWAAYDQWPKIRVVHCGLDPMFLKAEHVAVPEARRLVCVGRMAEQKGLPILVEAAGRLRAEGVDFELTLVGGGPLLGEIEALVDRLGLRDRVRLAGWKSNAEVRDLIQQSRALVLPSFAEGLPVVLMEALALGRPVVSTWVAGIPELVQPGVNGWLVPPSSAEALAAALREVVEAPAAQLDAMGRRGTERAARRHDVAIEARKLADLIHESLGREPRPEPARLLR